MTDAFDEVRARAIELTIERSSLSPEAARLIKDKGLEIARGKGISGGVMAVMDREHLLLTLESYGTARPSHPPVAVDKAHTVVNYQTSSRGMGERMVELGLNKDDLAGQVKSTAGGGVGIWKDPEYKIFLGATAFSGGTPDQDEDVSYEAVQAAGFYSRITPRPEKAPEVSQAPQAPAPQR